MNKESSDIRPAGASESDTFVERKLDACDFVKADTGRIVMLVHEKIRREREMRRRRVQRLLAWGVSAAACVALVVALGLRNHATPTSDLSSASGSELADAGYKELQVPAGERRELILADGTRLIANSCTRVLYPEKFSGKERRIYANGEVFLEVAKDRSHPFVVESAGFDVRVLGTVFNIRNTSDSTAAVVLVEGSVEIDMDNNRSLRLKPNDKAELLNGDVTSLTQIDPYDYTSWTKGLLNLKGMPLSELLHNVSRYYGVDIRCHQSLTDVRIYGKLYLHNNVDTVLESIRVIVPMKITKEGDGILLKP